MSHWTPLDDSDISLREEEQKAKSDFRLEMRLPEGVLRSATRTSKQLARHWNVELVMGAGAGGCKEPPPPPPPELSVPGSEHQP